MYILYCVDQFRLRLSPPNNHLSPFQVTEGHCWTRGDENDDDDNNADDDYDDGDDDDKNDHGGVCTLNQVEKYQSWLLRKPENCSIINAGNLRLYV